jgi:hypothetical protein
VADSTTITMIQKLITFAKRRVQLLGNFSRDAANGKEGMKIRRLTLDVDQALSQPSVFDNCRSDRQGAGSQGIQLSREN